MDASSVTPLLLTYDEAPNVGRALERLSWAKSVVVVDSFSRDETADIAGRFPNVRFFRRAFDSHAGQWNFGLTGTGIDTEWVLALDADYLVPGEFAAELGSLEPPEGVAGFRAQFRYVFGGRPLRASVYPPVTVLFRRERGRYVQDGHTQRLSLEGGTRELSSVFEHDDRKPFRRWLASQRRYMALEADKLSTTPFARLDAADRVRKLRVVAPPAVFLYCCFVKGLVLDGAAGVAYAAQRGLAEAVLSAELLKRDTRRIFG